jgi:hypothetical protein
LEPLFKPWEEPTLHRLPNPRPGQPAIITPGRQPSKVPLVRAIRAEVDAWRRGGYTGVSETSRTLLLHWFANEHLVKNDGGDLVPFRYHWAQREATETFIHLYELHRVRKPIPFVMTEDAAAANEIADYLDSDAFPLLKGRVPNIHTRLKGRVKEVRNPAGFRRRRNHAGIAGIDLWRGARRLSSQVPAIAHWEKEGRDH